MNRSLKIWFRRAAAVGLVSTLCLVAAGTGLASSQSYDPSSDGYSMSAITQSTGAASWWNAGYTGKGIDVALIDTGVSPVQGLSAPGKVLNGPDLSLESQAPNLTHLDTNGHGTFMAGLIAGHDDALAPPYGSASASVYRGIAPDARIVSLKVGTADGGVDVSQMVAAIDWVVQHAHDPGLNIRVINLSYGTNSVQDYQQDPLAYAVEQAWKHGILVVAAAGNTGYQKGKNAPGLSDPAYDPYVIGVAGVDTTGTQTLADDSIASYSASGCAKGCKLPDFATPGTHLQGLRVPNSFVDANHPEGYLDPRYFRGSGTSEAAAIASGAIALVLQKYPSLTPDQVKNYLANNARPLKGAINLQQGAGEIQLAPMLSKVPPKYIQNFKNSTGTGTLEGARGTDHLTRDGVTLTGETDIFGRSFFSGTMALAEAAGNSWSGGTWNGNSWSGNTWSGNSWSGNTWSGNSWSGNTWSTNVWTTNTWSANSWSGGSWAGSSFSGSSWTGGTWAGGPWG